MPGTENIVSCVTHQLSQIKMWLAFKCYTESFLAEHLNKEKKIHLLKGKYFCGTFGTFPCSSGRLRCNTGLLLLAALRGCFSTQREKLVMPAPSLTMFLTLQLSTWTQQEWTTLEFETVRIPQSSELRHAGLSLMFWGPQVPSCSLRNLKILVFAVSQVSVIIAGRILNEQLTTHIRSQCQAASTPQMMPSSSSTKRKCLEKCLCCVRLLSVMPSVHRGSIKQSSRFSTRCSGITSNS